VPTDYRGRRLIVLFFDLSAMQPEEIERMSTAARDYVETKLAPADLIAVVSLSSTLQVLQDFTSDRERLLSVIARFDPNSSEGFQEGPTADDASAAATADADAGGGEFVPDDSEFNLFNTDRRLQALGDVATTLGAIEQRKSIVYFSGGMGRTGVDNQILLRRTIDQAVRANVAIYAMDSRGLQAVVPGGEAQQASTRGTGAFSGAAMRGRVDSNFASQEALSALARDTGGQAVFDSNDFGEVFDRVVADTASYYVIGYESTNRAKDGKFRRIKVQVRGDYKIEHRSGYYAGRDFQHSTREDRERQLQDQLTAELSATDLPVYLTAAYFRLTNAGTRYAVPVTVAVPGSKIPFVQSGDKAKATLDLLGLVIDERQRPIARVRDTVSLAVEGQNATNRNIQYQTTLELPPGRYRMKVVVRENEQGTLGSFESEVTVPSLESDRLKVSSVVMGTRIGAADRSKSNPLATLAEGLVPSVAPVVSARQRMYFYFEVYDPQAGSEGAANGAPNRGSDTRANDSATGTGANATEGSGNRAKSDGGKMNADTPVRVLASLTFLRGGTRVYQTGVVDVTRLTAPDRHAAVFRLEVPPASLAPGLYTCQINIIDDVAGAFVFPRMTLAVRQ
jgi:VWFA-related protein